MAEKNGRALILAAGMRLQYRTLYCSADCFEKVYVAGTGEALPLRLSAVCAGFTQLSRPTGRFSEIDVDEINALCRRLEIDLVIPSDGETTRWLAQNSAGLVTRSFPVPSVEIFDSLDDKRSFGALCEQLGVPVPPTATFDDAAMLADAIAHHAVRLPSVIKPLRMWGSFGVARLDEGNAASIISKVDYKPILVQDYVPGRDLSAFFACRNGAITASVVYQKTEDCIHFFRHDSILAFAQKIIAHHHYDGVIGFDIRERPDGALFFIECNPRFWYNMDFARRAGMNFVALGQAVANGSISSEMPEAWIPRARTLYAHAPWNQNSETWKLLKYYASDFKMHIRMFLHSRFGFHGGHSL